MPQPTDPARLATDEYRALRATIAARGHLRLILFVGGLIAWSLDLVAVLVLLPNPLLAAVPLTVLVATFEAIRSAHFGAERIGRYLQVFFEERGPAGSRLPATGNPDMAWDPPAWERAVVRVGGRVPGAAGHPLFMPVLAAATIINSIAVVLPGPTFAEWSTLGALHLAFIAWMLHVDRGVRAQRAHDEARFRALRESGNTNAVSMSTKDTKDTKTD